MKSRVSSSRQSHTAVARTSESPTLTVQEPSANRAYRPVSKLTKKPETCACAEGWVGLGSEGWRDTACLFLREGAVAIGRRLVVIEGCPACSALPAWHHPCGYAAATWQADADDDASAAGIESEYDQTQTKPRRLQASSRSECAVSRQTRLGAITANSAISPSYTA